MQHTRWAGPPMPLPALHTRQRPGGGGAGQGGDGTGSCSSCGASPLHPSCLPLRGAHAPAALRRVRHHAARMRVWDSSAAHPGAGSDQPEGRPGRPRQGAAAAAHRHAGGSAGSPARRLGPERAHGLQPAAKAGARQQQSKAGRTGTRVEGAAPGRTRSSGGGWGGGRGSRDVAGHGVKVGGGRIGRMPARTPPVPESAASPRVTASRLLLCARQGCMSRPPFHEPPSHARGAPASPPAAAAALRRRTARR